MTAVSAPVGGAALGAAAVGAVRAGADRRPSAPALVWALPELAGGRTGVGTIPVCFPDGSGPRWGWRVVSVNLCWWVASSIPSGIHHLPQRNGPSLAGVMPSSFVQDRILP